MVRPAGLHIDTVARFGAIGAQPTAGVPDATGTGAWRAARAAFDGHCGPAWILLGAVVTRDMRSLALGIFASGIAATVAAFQIAVFTSFLEAGAAAPRYLAADAWISAVGIACFDFPTLIAEDYSGVIRSELPRATVRRVAFGFAGWKSPVGSHGNVALIGVDHGENRPRGFVVDRSDLTRLGLRQAGQFAGIGGRTMTYAGPVAGLSTFLGAPYVIAGFNDAREILGVPAGSTAFLAIDFPDGAPPDLAARLARLERAYPEISARTADQFLFDSSAYWQAKTGAGAAILLAAALASVLMAILLLNGIGRFVQRRTSDFVSMIGHGASDGQIVILLIGVAGMLIGGALAMAAVLVPILQLTVESALPWVTLKPIDAAIAIAIGGVCFALATASAFRELERFPPDVMFRS